MRKQKERIRIALQVLFKGTCEELQEAGEKVKEAKLAIDSAKLAEKNAEMAAEEAERIYYVFEQTIRMTRLDRPAILALGDPVQKINLPGAEIDICIGGHRGFSMHSSECIPMYIYTLKDVAGKYRINVLRENAEALESIKNNAAVELGKELIRQGLLKMTVHSSAGDYEMRTLHFSVPYYKLQ